MAVTSHWYSLGIIEAYKKTIDWANDTIKVMVTTSSYTPDLDTHDFKNDVTNETTGTGYTAGGATLTSKTLTYTAGTNTITFDAADVSWTTSTFTGRHIAIYDSTPGTDATRPLLWFNSSDVDLTSTADTWMIVWDPLGIATIVVS